MSQDAYTNFKTKRKQFSRLPTLVDRIDEQWQADLMDMSFWSADNDQNKYLLVVIDILSRFAWVKAVKDKKSSSIIKAFELILATCRKPEKLQTDQGREFKNIMLARFCSSKGIHFFTTSDSSVKCALAERFIRTLRARIYRYIYWKHTHRYIDDLQMIVDNYNNSYHRTIKTTPRSVTADNQQSIVQTIQQSIKENPKRKRTFDVNQEVKIPMKSSSFEKGAVQQWTDEVFKIDSLKETPQKFIYKLKDLAGEHISSIFYPEELQKVKYDPDASRRMKKC
jgi:ligand-binding SRPBCC domain-containing protein